jgi:hypothetical protein
MGYPTTSSFTSPSFCADRKHIEALAPTALFIRAQESHSQQSLAEPIRHHALDKERPTRKLPPQTSHESREGSVPGAMRPHVREIQARKPPSPTENTFRVPNVQVLEGRVLHMNVVAFARVLDEAVERPG